MFGKELRQITEGARAYANRRNGQTNQPVGIMEGVVGQQDMVATARATKAPIFNPDGTLWQPQNEDGSFPPLRGYDYPADQETP